MENMEIKEFYSNKKVLVTGHTGFKGSWLCAILLNMGAKICGVALEPNEDQKLFKLLGLDKDNRLSNNYIDVRNYEELKKVFDDFKPEIVIHLAAQPLVIESYKDPKYTYDVNINGTLNVCECVKNCNTIKSFVNVTTDKVYENIEESDHKYKEDEKLNGYDPYSNSKSCSELVTQTYKRCFFDMMDVSVSTCRAGNVIGGGDFSMNRIIPDCVKATLENKTIEVRNPDSIRPYQHVLEADVFYLEIAMKQFENKELSGSYNIGPNDEDCVSTGTIVREFVNSWEGATYDIKKVEGPHEATFLKLDTNKAREVLMWKPKWDIKESIQKTVEWYKVYEKGIDVSNITNKQIEDYLGN